MPGLLVGSRSSYVGRDFVGSPEWLASGNINFQGTTLVSKGASFTSTGLIQFNSAALKNVNKQNYSQGSILFIGSTVGNRNREAYSAGQITFGGTATYSVSKLGASIWNALSSSAVASVVGASDVWGM